MVEVHSEFDPDEEKFINLQENCFDHVDLSGLWRPARFNFLFLSVV